MPYHCEKCDFSSTRFYNLVRHQQRKHHDTQQGDDDQSEQMDDEQIELESEQESENEPGNGSEPESEDGSEQGSESEDESEDTEYEQDLPKMYYELLEHAWDQHDSQFEELVQEYVSEGKSEDVAKQEAYIKIQPLYRKSFRKEYADMLIKIRELKRDATYKSVMQSAKILRDEEEFDTTEESLRAAVTKRKYLLNELVEDDYDKAFPEDMEDEWIV